MSTQIDRISELAKEDTRRQFYSIAHMITPEALYAAFRGLRKKASAGVDGVTYEEYERDAPRNIQTLHERLKNGKYQAQPLRRVYIPKENGKQRPISIPALEDKIVQKAMVEVLNAIYVAAKLVDVLADERSARETCPVVPVAIPGGGAGDQSVESPGVKVLVGKVRTESAPTG